MCPSTNLTDAQIQASGAICPVAGLTLFGIDHLNSVVAPGHASIPSNSVVTLDNVSALTGLNAQQFADILSRDGFTSSMYESCEARLDVLMAQAINELEHNLTPPELPQPGLVPGRHLTNEQGLWWFFQHCTTKTRWWMIVSIVTVLLAVITAAYFAGRNQFINQVVDLWRQTTRP